MSILAAAFGLMLTMASPSVAHAGSYYASPPDGALKFAVGAPKCNGCPKGDKIQLNPAVYEYVLSQQASFVRSHYAGMAVYVAAGSLGEKQDLYQQQVGGDLNHIYGTQKAFIDGATGGTDVWTAIGADKDGTVFSRAVGLSAAEGANAMLAKKGQAQFTWGIHWKAEGDAVTLPKQGMTMTILVADEAAKTVTVHLWSVKKMITTVRKASAIYDLSGVAGAFDPAASLDFDTVKAGAKTTEGPLALDINAGGLIVGPK
jgi:hypothetical protein